MIKECRGGSCLPVFRNGGAEADETGGGHQVTIHPKQLPETLFAGETAGAENEGYCHQCGLAFYVLVGRIEIVRVQ